jgi:hypothetical protein
MCIKTVMILGASDIPFDGIPRLVGNMEVLAEVAGTGTYQIIGRYVEGVFYPLLEIITDYHFDMWLGGVNELGVRFQYRDIPIGVFPEGTIVINRALGGCVGRYNSEGEFEPI